VGCDAALPKGQLTADYGLDEFGTYHACRVLVAFATPQSPTLLTITFLFCSWQGRIGWAASCQSQIPAAFAIGVGGTVS
jgi:hypothetical protein